MARETVSYQAAQSIANQLKQMLKEIENLATERLLTFVPVEEQKDIYVKVKIEQAFAVNLSLYNNLTKALVVKSYNMTSLLQSCSDIFKVTAFVDSDTKTLYNKSKEKVFNQNTTIHI